jgi:hypothetical protein
LLFGGQRPVVHRHDRRGQALPAPGGEFGADVRFREQRARLSPARNERLAAQEHARRILRRHRAILGEGGAGRRRLWTSRQRQAWPEQPLVLTASSGRMNG